MLVIRPTQASNTPSIASAATALAANAARIGWTIQNQGQNPLFVLLGSGASTSVFHIVLAAATANDDGKGGIYSQTNGAVFTGPVTIAGSSPRYTVLEMAP
jgi:hypothetical protein